VLVHILGEVGTFYAVLLLVYPSTCVRIFIGIGLYLTDTEHKIDWHRFFETRCIISTMAVAGDFKVGRHLGFAKSYYNKRVSKDDKKPNVTSVINA